MPTDTPVSNRTHKTPTKGYGANIDEGTINEEAKSDDELEDDI